MLCPGNCDRKGPYIRLELRVLFSFIGWHCSRSTLLSDVVDRCGMLSGLRYI